MWNEKLDTNEFINVIISDPTYTAFKTGRINDSLWGRVLPRVEECEGIFWAAKLS